MDQALVRWSLAAGYSEICANGCALGHHTNPQGAG